MYGEDRGLGCVREIKAQTMLSKEGNEFSEECGQGFVNGLNFLGKNDVVNEGRNNNARMRCTEWFQNVSHSQAEEEDGQGIALMDAFG